MNETSMEILNLTFSESAQELLGHYGIEAKVTDTQGAAIELVATIGFGADGIAGALAMCTTSLCAKYLAHAVGAQTEHDWLGELSNQLLGQVKLRLHNRGVSFAVGVPVLLRGERIEVARSFDLSRSIMLALETPEGILECWLDFKAAPHIELSPEPLQEPCTPTGEMLFF